MLDLKHQTSNYDFFSTLDEAWDDPLAELAIVEACANRGRLDAEPIWPSNAREKASVPGRMPRDIRGKRYLDFLWGRAESQDVAA